MLHAVGVQLGVGDLEINDRVDLHGDVILGDHGLGRKVRYLLFQADLFGHALNKGHLQVQAHIPYGAERTQALHHIGPGLLHDDDVADDQQQNQDDKDGNNDPLHKNSSIFIALFGCVCKLYSTLFFPAAQEGIHISAPAGWQFQ